MAEISVPKTEVRVVNLSVKVARQLDIVDPSYHKLRGIRDELVAKMVLGRFDLKTLGRDYPRAEVLVIQLDREAVLMRGAPHRYWKDFTRLILS